MTKKRRYIFSLAGVNLEKVDQKYGIGLPTNTIMDDRVIPENTTKIEDLDTVQKSPEIVSFLDESKRVRKCTVSMVDFSTQKPIPELVSGGKHKHQPPKKYKCFWDRNFLPEGFQPIGCPINHISSQATKTYFSEITRDTYIIKEFITSNRLQELKKRRDSRISLQEGNFYETDGIFCSFNCIMAYINSLENKNNPLYRNSEELTLKMYYDLYDEEVATIMSAPHWRTLEEFGGNSTIEQFRESFNKIEYVDHGIITCYSLGRLYEGKIKF